MRISFLGVLLALVLATPAGAIGKRTALLNVQQECAAVGDIAFGENQRWAKCTVTRGRWLATIAITDMYQVQYCLGSAEGSCEQRALLVFGNRAYTPVADLLFQRIDAGEIDYDDPQVVKNDYGRILTISAHLPGGLRDNNYFLWNEKSGTQSGEWVPIDTQAWRKELARKLPAGMVASENAWPDVDTMSAKARLFRKEDPQRSANAGVVQVDFGVAGNRFVVKKVTFGESAE